MIKVLYQQDYSIECAFRVRVQSWAGLNEPHSHYYTFISEHQVTQKWDFKVYLCSINGNVLDIKKIIKPSKLHTLNTIIA